MSKKKPPFGGKLSKGTVAVLIALSLCQCKTAQVTTAAIENAGLEEIKQTLAETEKKIDPEHRPAIRRAINALTNVQKSNTQKEVVLNTAVKRADKNEAAAKNWHWATGLAIALGAAATIALALKFTPLGGLVGRLIGRATP